VKYLSRQVFSQQQTIDVVTSVVSALKKYARANGVDGYEMNGIELSDDDLTDLVCSVVPQALQQAGVDLPWIKNVRRN
jgi:hypothetical protein